MSLSVRFRTNRGENGMRAPFDQNGKATSYAYDDVDRLIAVTLAGSCRWLVSVKYIPVIRD